MNSRLTLGSIWHPLSSAFKNHWVARRSKHLKRKSSFLQKAEGHRSHFFPPSGARLLTAGLGKDAFDFPASPAVLRDIAQQTEAGQAWLHVLFHMSPITS